MALTSWSRSRACSLSKTEQQPEKFSASQSRQLVSAFPESFSGPKLEFSKNAVVDRQNGSQTAKFDAQHVTIFKNSHDEGLQGQLSCSSGHHKFNQAFSDPSSRFCKIRRYKRFGLDARRVRLAQPVLRGSTAHKFELSADWHTERQGAAPESLRLQVNENRGWQLAYQSAFAISPLSSPSRPSSSQTK